MAKAFQTKIGDTPISVRFLNWAEQADGNVVVSLGETTVLATCVMAKEEMENPSFFPLTVEYLERYYAAGKIRGHRYIKREARPSDEAICNARLIDRTIRPLFPKEFKREVQIILTVLSWDGKNDPDVAGILATSIALGVSDIPWNGPVGAVRVGKKEDAFVANPTYEERNGELMDIIFSGPLNENKSDALLNMVEAGFEEVEEEAISSAFDFAKPIIKELCLFQESIIKELGREKFVISIPLADSGFEKTVRGFLKGKMETALFQSQKKERTEGIESLKKNLTIFIQERYPNAPEKIALASELFDQLLEKTVHQSIIEQEKRPDGRGIQELRELSCEVGVLPRTHGSGLFSRGQTRTLSILTLGAPDDVQILEGMEIVGEKHFMHHYNFPPYAPGEIAPLRGPGRREIGHGMLAEKALMPVIPSFENFPYTMRVVSEVLSSNGSTSMASVSSASLALMDAGVPIKRPVTGIALGLMSDEKGNYKIITDIQGSEDHHGDMDFKIAGTKIGITAAQLDVRIRGITAEIFTQALTQGKLAREEILNAMGNILPEPRPELSPFAPRIYILQINPKKIRDVIGPGGKIINEIIADTGVAIDIQQTGKIFITSESEEAADKAVEWIKNITREVKVGEIFQGKVKRILDFGAMAEILPGVTGLIHISQLAPFRVRNVTDVVKLDDMVPVKVISIDEQGRINLSLKEAKTEDIPMEKNRERPKKWRSRN